MPGSGLKKPSLSLHDVFSELLSLGSWPTVAQAEAHATDEYGGVTAGMWYYNTTLNDYFYWNGTIWLSNNVYYLGRFASSAEATIYATNNYGGLVEGMWYWNTTAHCVFYWNGTTWVSGDVNIIEHPVFDWLLSNGAVADTLNGGRISTSNLPKSSTVPAIQFKVDLYELLVGTDLLIVLIGCHSTASQTLNLDLDNTIVNPGENFNTKAVEATLNLTPVTPAVAYDRMVTIFTVPHAQLQPNGSFEGRLTRNVGAETGDYHAWQIRAYQIG